MDDSKYKQMVEYSAIAVFLFLVCLVCWLLSANFYLQGGLLALSLIMTGLGIHAFTGYLREKKSSGQFAAGQRWQTYIDRLEADQELRGVLLSMLVGVGVFKNGLLLISSFDWVPYENVESIEDLKPGSDGKVLKVCYINGESENSVELGSFTRYEPALVPFLGVVVPMLAKRLGWNEGQCGILSYSAEGIRTGEFFRSWEDVSSPGEQHSGEVRAAGDYFLTDEMVLFTLDDDGVYLVSQKELPIQGGEAGENSFIYRVSDGKNDMPHLFNIERLSGKNLTCGQCAIIGEAAEEIEDECGILDKVIETARQELALAEGK